MSWIDKILPSGINKTEGAKRSSVPEGVWSKCVKCEAGTRGSIKSGFGTTKERAQKQQHNDDGKLHLCAGL